MQRENARLIKDAIKEFIQSEGLGEGLLRTRIFSVWDEVVGLTAAKYTYDKFYTDGKFFCRIRSSMVRTQLSFIKEELRLSMNQRLKRDLIKEIILR